MSTIDQELEQLDDDPTLEELQSAISRIQQDITGGSFLNSERRRRVRAANEFLARVAQQLELPGLYTLPNGNLFVYAGDPSDQNFPRTASGANMETVRFLARRNLVPQAKLDTFDDDDNIPEPSDDRSPFERRILRRTENGLQIGDYNVTNWLEDNPEHFYSDQRVNNTEANDNRDGGVSISQITARVYSDSVDDLKQEFGDDARIFDQAGGQVNPEVASAAGDDQAGLAAATPANDGDGDGEQSSGEASSDLAAFATSGKGGLRNDRNETAAITELQTFLNGTLGLNVGADGVDGRYGPRTTEAVKTFQQLTGLDDDGDAGPNTIAKIQEVQRDLEELNRLIEEAGRETTNSSYDPIMQSTLGKLLYEELSTEQQTRLNELLEKYQTLIDGLPEDAPIRTTFTNARTVADGGTVSTDAAASTQGVTQAGSLISQTPDQQTPLEPFTGENTGSDGSWSWRFDTEQRTIDMRNGTVERNYTEVEIDGDQLVGQRDGSERTIDGTVAPNLFQAYSQAAGQTATAEPTATQTTAEPTATQTTAEPTATQTTAAPELFGITQNTQVARTEAAAAAGDTLIKVNVTGVEGLDYMFVSKMNREDAFMFYPSGDNYDSASMAENQVELTRAQVSQVNTVLADIVAASFTRIGVVIPLERAAASQTVRSPEYTGDFVENANTFLRTDRSLAEAQRLIDATRERMEGASQEALEDLRLKVFDLTRVLAGSEGRIGGVGAGVVLRGQNAPSQEVRRLFIEFYREVNELVSNSDNEEEQGWRTELQEFPRPIQDNLIALRNEAESWVNVDDDIVNSVVNAISNAQDYQTYDRGWRMISGGNESLYDTLMGWTSYGDKQQMQNHFRRIGILGPNGIIGSEEGARTAFGDSIEYDSVLSLHKRMGRF